MKKQSIATFFSNIAIGISNLIERMQGEFGQFEKFKHMTMQEEGWSPQQMNMLEELACLHNKKGETTEDAEHKNNLLNALESNGISREKATNFISSAPDGYFDYTYIKKQTIVSSLNVMNFS